MLSFEFLLRLSAILKLDFLKSPGKSGSARHPRGMKLGNSESFGPENICFAFLVVPDKCKKKGTIEAFRLFSRELFGKRL